MKTEKSRVALQIIILFVCVFTIILLYIHFYLRTRSMEKQKKMEASSSRRTPIVLALEKVMPSVVNLSTEYMFRSDSPGPAIDRKDIAISRSLEKKYSVGSGIIIDASTGLLLTSAHVVHHVWNIEVTLNDGRSFQARTVAENPEDDIALLRIESKKFGVLKSIEPALPGDVILGETVIAVGNPFGLGGTVTVGILSGIDRILINNGEIVQRDLLQTDVAVFPGNSGGPLVNLDGEMVGMNMAVRKDSPGISFAIPMLRISNILGRWMLPDRVNQTYLGIVPAMASDGTVFIESVFPGSPAYRAGIRAGMVIRSYMGWNPHGNLIRMCRKMLHLKPGDSVAFTFAEKPGRIVFRTEKIDPGDGVLLAKIRLALGIQNMSTVLAKALNHPFSDGVVINDPPPSLRSFGIRRGDLLIRIGARNIHSLDDVAKALQDPANRNSIKLFFASLRRKNGKVYFVESNHVLRTF